MNRNSIPFGLFLAIIVPLLIFAIVFLIRFHDIGYLYVLKDPSYQRVFSKILSLCVYPNGLVFLYYIRTNRLHTMRGMVFGTIAMALLVVILYFALG